ncbi:MAG TPA: glycosyltransferase, partial [Dehalococcoidia bacterium]
DDVYALLKGAKAAVSTSEQEGFGITVVEAQACGTPPIVVASPHSAAPELVRHEHDGLVCDASPEAIAGAIMRVARDADFRAHLAGNAATAAARFDWDRITEQTDALYRRLLRDGAREIGQAEERVAA